MPERAMLWIVLRRHPIRADGKPCPGCGKTSIHEMMGIGMADGNMSAEEMAKTLATTENDYIGPIPPNVLLPEAPCFPPGAYYPLTGQLVEDCDTGPILPDRGA